MRSWRRTAIVPVPDVHSACSSRRVAASGSVFIVDLENTLVPYGAPPDEWRRQMESCASRNPTVVFVSNAARMVGGDRGSEACVVFFRARKPFTSLKRLRTVSTAIGGVIGDQILTDGLLAWRLRRPFFYVAGLPGREPPWPRTQRRFGNAIKVLFFAPTELGSEVG